jgi:hypothetical protein
LKGDKSPMSIQTVVQELRDERVRIDKALAVLESPEPRRAAAPVRTPSTGKRTFTMSAEAKQKIAVAQKKRWASIKKGMTSKAA